MSEGTIARKRLSIYLVLIIWGVASAEMTPGFHTIVVGTILLVCLGLLRSISHFEGQYMLKAAEAEHSAATAHAVVFRRLGVEFAVTIGLTTLLMIVVFWAVRHIPILWMSSPAGTGGG